MDYSAKKTTMMMIMTTVCSHIVVSVLGRFLWALNKHCLETYGMSYDISDYYIYDFATVWKVSQEHSRDVVHGFFKSERSVGVSILEREGGREDEQCVG